MATLFTCDFEEGDLTDFDGTHGTLSNIASASATAAKTGDYGMLIEGDGSTVAYGYMTVSETEIYIGAHIYIEDFTVAGYRLIEVLGSYPSRFSSTGSARLFVRRWAGGDGSLTTWEDGGGHRSATNFSLDAWHWVEIRHRVNDASTGGWQIWIDGDLVFDYLAQDLSGSSSITAVVPGNRNDAYENGLNIYYDNVIGDDASRVTEPTEAGGTTLTVFTHHYAMMRK